MKKPNIDICIPIRDRYRRPDNLELLNSETTGKIRVSYVKPLSKARAELIRRVNTELFFFLDDDVEYRTGHLKYLLKFMEPNVGAVQGQLINVGLGSSWDKAVNPRMTRRIVRKGKRVMTHNTVVRTELVKDWVPTDGCSGAEDWDLTRHIQDKWYTCVIAPSKVEHRRNWGQVWRNGIWHGKAYVHMTSKAGGSLYLLKLSLGITKYLVTLPFHPRLSIYTFYQNTAMILGVAGGLFR